MPENVVPIASARSKRRGAPSTSRQTSAPRNASAAATPKSTPLPSLLDSWKIYLEDAGKSPNTIRLYLRSGKYFCNFLDANGFPLGVEEIETEPHRKFLAAETERTCANSARQHWRNLKVMWNWLIREGERHGGNPMDGVGAPDVKEKAKQYLTGEQIAALLKTCTSTSFIDRRDTAIIRIFADAGPRVSGIAGIRYTPDEPKTNDVFLTQRKLRIVLKGGDELMIPLGRKSALALDRYLRVRAKHRLAHMPGLWLSASNRAAEHMTASGIRKMVERRALQAGIDVHLHPHIFRATWGHMYLDGGGDVYGMMAIAGWKSFKTARGYVEGLAQERALKAHEHLSPGDRI